ncbi:MAG TPA: hypothetical protein VHD36_03830 [Pirellulales bacterium]|nr:hypothetical protein [Pirellulales bacterium]
MTTRPTTRIALLLSLAAAAALASRVQAQADATPASRPLRATDEAVIRALAAARPTTPVELVKAARIILDLGQPALAKPFVQKLAGAKLDDEACAALVDEVGSAVLLRLARDPALAPVAGQFCNATLDGAQRHARDPARLAALVKQLAGAAPYEEATIIAALRPGADASALALITALADNGRAAEHPAIVRALIELGKVASGPLVALLGSRDAQLVAHAAQILGELDDPSIAGHLLGPALAADSPAEVSAAARAALDNYFGRVPTNDQALAILLRKGQRSLDFVKHPERNLPSDVDPAPLVWQWDDAKKKLTGARVTPALAEVIMAVGSLADARRVAPANADVRRLYLAALAEAIAYAGDSPAVAARVDQAKDLLAQANLLELQDLLSYSLAEDRPAAATVAARLLGESENVDLLYAHSPQGSALARALLHPSRDLRFAALEAIMRLNPRSPYPGAGVVAETLEYFARSTGFPKALVAAADATEAGRLAGLLAEQGYEPDIAVDATSMLRMARASTDYEVIFVDSALALPSSAQLLQRLRSDSRLARIPLAVVSMADEFPQVERVARRYPLCMAVMRVHNAPAMQFELNRLLQRSGRVVVPGEVRREQGIKALEWIAALASERQQIYDTRRLDLAVIGSLDTPGMTEAAIATLGRLDTNRAQRALVDLASRPTAALAARQESARAFADSVARRGTLLTSEEIARQYDRYNASEHYDADTQTVLADILDVIEARAKADWLALEQNDSPTP